MLTCIECGSPIAPGEQGSTWPQRDEHGRPTLAVWCVVCESTWPRPEVRPLPEGVWPKPCA